MPQRDETVMTRREVIAMHALCALIGKANVRGNELDYSRAAVHHAEALLNVLDGRVPLSEPKPVPPPPSVL